MDSYRALAGDVDDGIVVVNGPTVQQQMQLQIEELEERLQEYRCREHMNAASLRRVDKELQANVKASKAATKAAHKRITRYLSTAVTEVVHDQLDDDPDDLQDRVVALVGEVVAKMQSTP